ncbi:hypothetical protein SUGI_1204260 [Cryptomeria japonica]|nr:hypothetical protein SUGI_1204260 [Cryptomeria japonica]
MRSRVEDALTLLHCTRELNYPQQPLYTDNWFARRYSALNQKIESFQVKRADTELTNSLRHCPEVVRGLIGAINSPAHLQSLAALLLPVAAAAFPNLSD